MVAPSHSSWHVRRHLCLVKLFTEDSSEAMGKVQRWGSRTPESWGPIAAATLRLAEAAGVLPCSSLCAVCSITRLCLTL